MSRIPIKFTFRGKELEGEYEVEGKGREGPHTPVATYFRGCRKATQRGADTIETTAIRQLRETAHQIEAGLLTPS